MLLFDRDDCARLHLSSFIFPSNAEKRTWREQELTRISRETRTIPVIVLMFVTQSPAEILEKNV